jgi:hypothetical protein
MSGPFPGMDPWLEEPNVWVGVHPRLLIYIADTLQPLLGNRYIAAVEERAYITTVEKVIAPDVMVREAISSQYGPACTAVAQIDDAVVIEIGDVEARESYIEIRDIRSGEEVVTVIEVVSPSNKRAGTGREEYLDKQKKVLSSRASLVEIDLLRGGTHLLAVPETEARDAKEYDYLVSISTPGDHYKRFRIYPRTIRERLPRILIPLKPSDPLVPLDIQALLDRVYETGIYATRLDYSKRCHPRLRHDDEAWAQERIKAWQAAAQA